MLNKFNKLVLLTGDNIFKYYDSELFKSLLNLPSKTNLHHFRFKIIGKKNTYFLRIKDRINNKEQFVQWIHRLQPIELFMTPNEWLDPVFVRKSRTHIDVLLSANLYIDIDENKDNKKPELKKAHEKLNKIILYIKERYDMLPNKVSFSGNKGFHIIYNSWDWNAIRELSPNQRIVKFKENRLKLWKDMTKKGIMTDKNTMIDPYRILRIPGSLNMLGMSPCFLLNKKEWLSFNLFCKKLKKTKIELISIIDS